MGRRPVVAETRIYGWCPSAWRPMMAGDGLLVRVRPALSRISRDQMLGLCAVADAFGNGAIDLTNRGALQIRGVNDAGLAAMLERLVSLDLVAADPAVEGRPPILVAPDWMQDDGTEVLMRDLAERIGGLPDLPGKTGFAIDVAGAPVLGHAPADFRLELGRDGGLIVRADGRATGVAVDVGDAVDTLLDLARWFAQSGGMEAGRMVRHAAPLPAMLDGDALPAAPRSLHIGKHPLGCIHGIAFGRIEAGVLADALKDNAAAAIRITPYRQILLEGVGPSEIAGLILDPCDPAMRTDACVGAPACPQATVETRILARQLAPHVRGSLHVSGCAKGCARSSRADVVLTGRGGAFDLGFDGRAGDPPARSGLCARHVLSLLGAS